MPRNVAATKSLRPAQIGISRFTDPPFVSPWKARSIIPEDRTVLYFGENRACGKACCWYFSGFSRSLTLIRKTPDIGRREIKVQRDAASRATSDRALLEAFAYGLRSIVTNRDAWRLRLGA
jgi:hypothetical protein